MLTTAVFLPWLGWLGIVAGSGVLCGLLELAGVPLAGTITAYASIVWSLWLIVAGIILLRAAAIVAAPPVRGDREFGALSIEPGA
jgi:hypothetical protein